jgi:hypothetical protein
MIWYENHVIFIYFFDLYFLHVDIVHNFIDLKKIKIQFTHNPFLLHLENNDSFLPFPLVL